MFVCVTGNTLSDFQVKYEEDEVTAASLGDVYKIRLILDPMSANNLDLYWKLDKVIYTAVFRQ